MDGDEDLDLVTANAGSNTISILRNKGDGTFAAKVDYATQEYPISIFASDLDSDGDDDLVAGHWTSNTIALFFNMSCLGHAIIQSLIPASVIESETLNLEVSVNIGCPLVPISALTLPPNSSFSDSGNGSGVFTFTPSYTQSGTYNVTFIACDTVACDSETVQITVNCGETKRGDPNGNGQITLPDIIYLTNYVFKGGASPVPEKCDGDANNDGNVTIADIIYLVNYIFKDGPPPSPATCCL